jgi:cytochrome c oxidase subunit 3
MMVKDQYVEEAGKPMAMHPKKFALWLFCVTVVMIFAAFTSYYLVKKSDGNWREIDLPNSFWFSTITILVSSATMHWAYLSAKKDEFSNLKTAITITFLLGLGFLVFQVMSALDLQHRAIFFGGRESNVAGSILYVIAGLHGLHLVGGIVFLLIVLFNSFNFKIHSKSLVQIEMCATYWHFLDGLWIYLFVFLLLNR